MIGLALSGGGSRAMAFHLGCFRALQDLGVLEKISVLSTISGGSVFGAYYAYSPELEFDEFDRRMQALLLEGLQRRLIVHALMPQNLLKGGLGLARMGMDRLAKGREGFEPHVRSFSRTELFAKVLQEQCFGVMTLSAPSRPQLELVIGACELRTGSAFRFSSKLSGGWRFGKTVDSEHSVAFAVAASAAYPIFLPALDRRWEFEKDGVKRVRRVLLTDGGVYDNLGIGVLEPGRSAEVSLHTFQCQYLIACSAGEGQEAGNDVPQAFFPRVAKSFGIVHRRVQDSAMNRLHRLKQSGYIRGFAMPYLGQQDHRLPWTPASLIPRAEVMNYPTNFAAMPRQWLDKIAARGEQLTRALLPYYLPELCTVD
jgi:NTE family protein